jgi:hypothetical protein
MSRRVVLLLSVLAWVTFPLGRSHSIRVPRHSASATPQALLRTYSNLPLSFERNDGQADPSMKFKSRGKGYTLFLTPTEAVIALRTPQTSLNTRSLASKPHNGESNLLRVEFAGANRNPRIEGIDRQPGKASYFIGNDTKKWLTKVPIFAGRPHRASC